MPRGGGASSIHRECSRNLVPAKPALANAGGGEPLVRCLLDHPLSRMTTAWDVTNVIEKRPNCTESESHMRRHLRITYGGESHWSIGGLEWVSPERKTLNCGSRAMSRG